MNKYKTTSKVTITSGKIGISDAQATGRLRRLKKVEEGLYEVIIPCCFQAGEVIELDNTGEYAFGNLDLLEDEEDVIFRSIID